jgi:hypothetical protein
LSQIGSGLKAFIISARAVGGLIISLLFGAILPSYGSTGQLILVFFKIGSIIATIELLDNMTYWSIGYALGWVIGVSLFGEYFLEPWEAPLYLVIAVISIIHKVSNKLKMRF